MVVCVEVEHYLGLVECGGTKVEMSRVSCCSIIHVDDISPVTSIQYGRDAMELAKDYHHPDTASVLKQAGVHTPLLLPTYSRTNQQTHHSPYVPTHIPIIPQPPTTHKHTDSYTHTHTTTSR